MSIDRNEAQDDEPLDISPPSWAKAINDWCKIIAGPSAVVGVVVTWFFGIGIGILTSTAFSIIFGVLLVVYFLVVANSKSIRSACAILDNSKYTQAEVRRKVSAKLARSLFRNYIAMAFLALVAVGCAIVAGWWPVYHLLYTKEPEDLEFQRVEYFQPRRDIGLLQEFPMLEAVLSSLQAEAQVEKGSVAIVWGETVSLDHPTPLFRARLQIGKGKLLVSGYALRKRSGGHSAVYENVGVAYPDDKSVVFVVPPSEKGDTIFVFARVAAAVEFSFPDDLKAETQLRVLRSR